MEQSIWSSMLNAPAPETGKTDLISAPAFSVEQIEQVEKIAPATPWGKLKELSIKKAAKEDKFSVDSIGRALENEISRRNGKN